MVQPVLSTIKHAGIDFSSHRLHQQLLGRIVGEVHGNQTTN